MRVVGVHEFGGPEALEVTELPDPQPGDGELLIRVHAAAVNPTDTQLRGGVRPERHGGAPPPYVPGMDVAGVVEGIGEGAQTDLSLGDRVMAIVLPGGSHGGYSELLALPAESVAAAPAGTSHAEAATLPMNGLTARMALDLLALSPGQTLAITGAAGTLGGYLTQLAKTEDLIVVADAGPADEELVRGRGADVVVARGDDVAGAIRRELPDGVDALVDASVQGESLMPAIADGGAYATVRGHQIDPPRGIQLHKVWVFDYGREQEKLDVLRQQAEAGILTLQVAGSFSAENAAEAHKRFEAGGVRGRLIIEF